MIPPNNIFWCNQCDKGYCACASPLDCIDAHTDIKLTRYDEEICEVCANKCEE